MAGDFVPEEELNLTGIKKYFNSYTLRGRFNFVVATYSSIFAMIAWYKYRKSRRSTQEETEPLLDSEVEMTKAQEPKPKPKSKSGCQRSEYY